MKTRCWLPLLLAICVIGCSPLKPRIGAFRPGKPIWPVRKVLLVSGEGSGILPLNDRFIEEIAVEFQQRLEAHGVATVSVVVSRNDLDARKAIRAAIDEHYPTHQLMVVAVHTLRAGAVLYKDRHSYEIKLSFTLSELQPYRDVWKGEAGFAGHPSGSKIAEAILARMVADGILK